MAISASSLNQDNVVRSDDVKARFEDGLTFVDSTITFNQGDLIYLDTTAHLIKRVAATGNAATLLGVAPIAITSGVVNNPYGSLATAQYPRAFLGPIYGGVFKFNLKSGDAFVPGGKVYLADGQDSQTVSSVDPGDANYVGLFDGAAVTAVAGSTGNIKVGCRYPVATGGDLQF